MEQRKQFIIHAAKLLFSQVVLKELHIYVYIHICIDMYIFLWHLVSLSRVNYSISDSRTEIHVKYMQTGCANKTIFTLLGHYSLTTEDKM